MLFKRVSLYHKGWQFSCHLTTGIKLKDSPLANVKPHIVYCTKISVSLYHKESHITGKNVKDLLPENVFTADCLLHKNKCKFIP